MVLLNFLRALADLGFYYCVAGMFSAMAGGRLAMEVFLLQSACFALSFSLRWSRAARLAALLPALLPFLFPLPLADILVSLPPLLYLAYLAWTGGYQLSWFRQVDMFPVFWKVFLVAAVLLVRGLAIRPVLTVGIPAALLTGAASALLMRSLRHEPVVYLQPGFQAVNFTGIGLVLLAALALGSEWALRALVFALRSFYEYVILPPLIGLSMLVGVIVLQLWPLIQWFIERYRERTSETLEARAAARQHFLESIRNLNPYGKGSELIVRILIAVVVLAAVAILALVFYWMIQRQRDVRGASTPARQDISAREGERAPFGSYAYRIRREYRAFLRLCGKRGLRFGTADTSTDVGEKALDAFPDEAALSALRDLYQEARYHGEASREDYQEFKRLLGALKKIPTP